MIEVHPHKYILKANLNNLSPVQYVEFLNLLVKISNEMGAEGKIISHVRVFTEISAEQSSDFILHYNKAEIK